MANPFLKSILMKRFIETMPGSNQLKGECVFLKPRKITRRVAALILLAFLTHTVYFFGRGLSTL